VAAQTLLLIERHVRVVAAAMACAGLALPLYAATVEDDVQRYIQIFNGDKREHAANADAAVEDLEFHGEVAGQIGQAEAGPDASIGVGFPKDFGFEEGLQDEPIGEEQFVLELEARLGATFASPCCAAALAKCWKYRACA
jgi:hypothetical protein